jgi:erythromycin esterase
MISSFFSIYLFSQKTTINLEGIDEQVYLINPKQNTFESWINSAPIFDSIMVLGMGEATHGTSDFFAMKAEIFKLLVLKYNFRVFGLESSMGSCAFINEILGSTNRNLDSAMSRLDYWPWKTVEMRSLFDWIQKYNTNQVDSLKIAFYGFDINEFQSPVHYLRHLIHKDTSSTYSEFLSIINPFLPETDYSDFKVNAKKENLSPQQALHKIHAQLQQWFFKNEKYLQAHYSRIEFGRINLLINNFKQALTIKDMIEKTIAIDNNYRDKCMAENVNSIQKLERKKMFIWAHNVHIQKREVSKHTILKAPMGNVLRNLYGSKYYSIGFLFNQGSFLAIQGPSSGLELFTSIFKNKKKRYKGLQTIDVDPNKNSSLLNQLSITGLSPFFVDIHASHAPIFSKPSTYFNVGAVFFKKSISFDRIIPKEQFDGIIFIEKTKAAEYHEDKF